MIEFETAKGQTAFDDLVRAIIAAPEVPEHEITAWVEANGRLPRTGRDYRRRRPKSDSLTSRQLRAIELLAAGLQEKEIAAALGCSRDTVKNHLGRARTRLGAKNAAHLVAVSIRRGLIS